jgi:uncharacterized protein (TIGR03435 family)
MRRPAIAMYVQPALLLIALIPASLQQAAAQATQPIFEVATVRPSAPDANPNSGYWSRPGVGRFTASHVSLAVLIQLAYDIDGSQIANGPKWLDTTLFDVEAKPEDGISLTRDELQPRLQALLRERFHLVCHNETRTGRGYDLVVAQGGPHLTPAAEGHFPGERHNVSVGHIGVQNCSMPKLAQFLTTAAKVPVVDQTGLAGSYDISFAYNPRPEKESDLPALEVALKEATGLLLKPAKVATPVLGIDSVDKLPTDN